MPVTGHPGPRTDLHKHLIRWRERAGLARAEMVRLLEQHESAIRHESPIRMWETGQRRIGLKGLAELARVYGVQPGDLLRPPPKEVAVVMGPLDRAPYRHLPEWRLSRGMSRPDMVEKSGFPLKTLTNYETGLRDVDLDVLAEFAAFYRVRPWALLASPPGGVKALPVAEKADPEVQANIEAWRLHRGLTRVQVAERSRGEFGDSALFEWEKQHRPMPARVVKVLARIYGQSMAALKDVPPRHDDDAECNPVNLASVPPRVSNVDRELQVGTKERQKLLAAEEAAAAQRRRLIAWREHSELSVAALARRIGRSEDFVDEIENGERAIALKDLVALAAAYGVSPDALQRPPPSRSDR